MRTHMAPKVLQRPEALWTERTEHLALCVVWFWFNVELNTLMRASGHFPIERVLNDSLHELRVILEVGHLVLLLHGRPVAWVFVVLVFEAHESVFERSIAQVALKRQVYVVLLEVPQEGLAIVERPLALPAVRDLVDVVVVSLRVDVLFRQSVCTVFRCRHKQVRDISVDWRHEGGGGGRRCLCLVHRLHQSTLCHHLIRQFVHFIVRWVFVFVIL